MLNTFMRFIEFISSLKSFTATIRVKGIVVKTKIEVESLAQARAMLSHIFGQSNVLNIVQSAMNEQGSGMRTLSADELKVQNLAQQREKYAKAEKQEKARQSLVKAQQRMRDAQSV
jgi:hypothetical protein